MTTFTSDDREEAYKKILEEAPNQPGYEDAVPMASPPHIVDSGASVMEMNANELADELDKYLKGEEYDRLVWEAPTMLRQQQDRIGVLEANHKIQLDINEKALQYIAKLEKGLDSSINLNKALVERDNKNET